MVWATLSFEIPMRAPAQIPINHGKLWAADLPGSLLTLLFLFRLVPSNSAGAPPLVDQGVQLPICPLDEFPRRHLGVKAVIG